MNAVLLAAIVVLAPLLQGVLRSARAKLAGRPGPSLLQPYRDLRKWWSKEALAPLAASPLAIAAPGLMLGVALTFAALVCTAGGAVPPMNAVAIALVLALGRFVLVLAALDARSSFGAMAASREMTFAALTEAPLILALVAADVAGTQTPVAAPLAAAALLLVMLAETARIPVDNQETHYELTMIHEGLVLEYSGWPLALLAYAAYVRQAAFFTLAAGLMPTFPGAAVVWTAAFVALVALIERVYAKLRLFEVPQLFASAAVLALAGIGLRIAGAGAW